jgi:hypothetical protein
MSGPLIDPDCRPGVDKHGSCPGDPCECPCHARSLRLAVEALIATGEDLGREFDRLQLDYALTGDASIIPRQDAVLDMIRANTKQLRVLVDRATP